MTAPAEARASRLLRGQDRIAYSFAQAAEATGYSYDVIRRAVNAGDIATKVGTINGRGVAKPVILRAALERWLIDRPDADT